jgi:hypothetical protein
MFSRLLAVALVLLACWTTPALTAHAQPAPGSYDDEVAQALAAHAAGDLEAARHHMERAHTLSPSARTLRGLGIIAHARCDYPAALSLLESALSEPVRPLDGELRSSVERLLTATRLKVGRYRLEVEPREAVVVIDSAAPSRDEQGEVVLLPGHHVVALSAPGHEPKRLELNTLGGEHSRIVARLVPAMEQSSPAASASPSGAPSRARRVSLSLLGVGGAFLISGLGTLIVAREKHTSIWGSCAEDELDGSLCESDAEREQRETAAKRLDRATGALGVLGAVSLGLALATWATPRHRTGRVVVRSQGAQLHMTF